MNICFRSCRVANHRWGYTNKGICSSWNGLGLKDSCKKSFKRELFTTQLRNYSDRSPSIPAHIVRLNNGLIEKEITPEKMLIPIEQFEPLEDSFAVVLIGGHQYKVTKGDELMIDVIDAPLQSKLLLDKVLLVGTKEHTVIGTPLLTKAKVHASVEEHSKTEKLIVYKRRGDTKTSRTRSGHRQPYTLLHILDIMVQKE